MANNNNIRTINLKANCNLSKMKNLISDYNGFYETNSVFLNDRIVNWYKKNNDSENFFNDLIAETNGNNFDIFKNGKKVMSIAKKGYAIEEVEEFPSDMQKIKEYKKDKYPIIAEKIPSEEFRTFLKIPIFGNEYLYLDEK